MAGSPQSWLFFFYCATTYQKRNFQEEKILGLSVLIPFTACIFVLGHKSLVLGLRWTWVFLSLMDFSKYTCTPMHIDVKIEEICKYLCTFMERLWTFLQVLVGGRILIFYYLISLYLQEKWHNCLLFQPKYVPECVHTFAHVHKHKYMCRNTLCVLVLFLLFSKLLY